MEVVQLKTKQQGNSQKTTTLSKENIQDNLGQDFWVFKQTDPLRQSQFSLQEKIVKIYQLIQQNTTKNVQKSKSNEVLKAQVEVYETIINKIENVVKLAQQKSKYIKKGQVIPDPSVDLLLKVSEDNIDRSLLNQPPKKEQNIDYEASNKKQKNRKKQQTRLNDENQQQSLNTTNEYKTTIHQHKNINEQHDDKKHHYHRFSVVGLDQDEIDWRQFISNKQIQKNINKQKITNRGKVQLNFHKFNQLTKKQQQFYQQINNKRKNTQYTKFQKCTRRISIQRAIEVDQANFGKTFLKKELMKNTRNYGFRKSAVSIEHLWNETQGSKFNQAENMIRMNNEPKKQLTKLMKQPINQQAIGKIKQKKPSNK